MSSLAVDLKNSSTRQVKMEAKRVKLKRKSPSAAIFELNDEDLSPENSDVDANGPDKKVQKISGDISKNREHNLKVDDENIEPDNGEKHEENHGECVVEEQETIVTIEINQETKNNEAEPAVTCVEITKDDIVEPIKAPEEVINLEDGEVHDEIDSSQNIDTSLEVIETTPCISIKFKDKEIAHIYRQKFIKFVQSFVELHIDKVCDDTTINIQRDVTLNPTEWVVLDDTICIEDEDELAQELPKTSPKKKKNKKKHKKAKELFVVDTMPTLEAVKVNLETKYMTKFSIDEKKEATEQIARKPNLTSTCFNCGSEHNLKDCPVPKNHAKIAAARKQFGTNKYKTSRYHLEEDQKYSHLAPGKLSQDLRKALGLKKHQVPHYIYQMRNLGYPPGWLEEAKFVSSNLSMFDIDGNDVNNKNVKNQGLDPSKVINYPGFNVPFEKGLKDEYKYYNVPPYSNDFDKEKMMEYFQKMEKTKEDDMEPCDMDIAEVKAKRVIELRGDSSGSPSPSLKDLEKEKEELLAQLDTKTDGKKSEPPVPGTEVDDSMESDPKSPEETSGNLPKVALTSLFGTPILKSSSPYSRLPNPDNFSKDVSPVINFENLPNSTGKYEQMTELLQKVRDTLRNKGGMT